HSVAEQESLELLRDGALKWGLRRLVVGSAAHVQADVRYGHLRQGTGHLALGRRTRVCGGWRRLRTDSLGGNGGFASLRAAGVRRRRRRRVLTATMPAAAGGQR